MRIYVILGLLVATPVSAADVTFTRDVAPILNKHCVSCHRDGEVGPFPLQKFSDVSKRASFIAEVTGNRKMPPWKPLPGEHSFKDERRLSEKEIATLAKWAETGAKEGDARDLPPAPQFVSGWQLGKPDLVLKMIKPFKVPATGRDVYQCFAIPLNIDEDRTVAAVEFRPGNPRVTHHSLLFLDNAGQGRKKDPDGNGFTTFGGPGIVPTGSLGGWAPGSTPRFLPDGMGLYIRGGSDLVMQLHYHPSGKEEQDQSQVGIYFTKEPAKHIVTGLAVLNRNFVLKAGEKHHEVIAETDALPVEVNLVGLFPHMHLLGKEMLVTAHYPDGKTSTLLHINDWDFNWQGNYQYKEPIKLPKGTVVKMKAVYDNSSDNPLNPNSPPKPVRWGEQTTDEMCLLGLRITTNSREDLARINRMNAAKMGARIFGGFFERKK